MLVDSVLEALLVPIFHLHLGKVAIDGKVFNDHPFVAIQIVGVGLGDFLVQEGVAHLVQLPDLRLGILNEVLVGVFLDSELEDLLSIEIGLQQLYVVLVFCGLLLNGIQFLLRRFRQVLVEVFLYFFPHVFIVVFWCCWDFCQSVR